MGTQNVRFRGDAECSFPCAADRYRCPFNSTGPKDATPSSSVGEVIRAGAPKAISPDASSKLVPVCGRLSPPQVPLREHGGRHSPDTPRRRAGDPVSNFLPRSHQGVLVSGWGTPALGEAEDRREQEELGRDSGDTLLPPAQAGDVQRPRVPLALPSYLPGTAQRWPGRGGRGLRARSRRSPDVRSPRSCSWRARRCWCAGQWRSGRLGGRERGARNASHRQFKEGSEAQRHHVLLLKGAQTRGTGAHGAVRTGGGQVSRGPRAHA